MEKFTWPKLRTAKITEEKAREIILRARSGKDDAPLAREYGMSESAIRSIRKGQSWRDLRDRMRAEGLDVPPLVSA
jgi:parvulin-like peptidyl-prolyl isomerase